MHHSTFATLPPGPVAQWSEQATHNRSVPGSIPGRPTNSRDLNGFELVTANQTGFAANTETDITGLATTWTAVAGRAQQERSSPIVLSAASTSDLSLSIEALRSPLLLIDDGSDFNSFAKSSTWDWSFSR